MARATTVQPCVCVCVCVCTCVQHTYIHINYILHQCVGTLHSEGRISDVVDKKSGALVLVDGK